MVKTVLSFVGRLKSGNTNPVYVPNIKRC